MAKKKNYWYVLVFTAHGPVYLTGIGEHHTAFWDVNEVPKECGKSMAEDIAWGLRLNGHNAIACCISYELSTHPYNYSDYECTWTEKEKDGEK